MNSIQKNLNERLAKKYTGHAYMYPEYPHKTYWPKTFNIECYKDALKKMGLYEKNVQFYIHIPFCKKLCLYCSCYKIVTKDYKKIKNNLNFIMKEIDLLRHLLDENSIHIDFKQVHLGGGSPSYLKQSDLGLLIDKIGTLLDINNLEEFAIEVDPRNITKDELIYYSKKGVNRLSFGVQDFDIHVQKAVNRIQPPQLLEHLLVPDIRKLFDSISFDILYGLPNQTLASFRKTIDTVLKLSPDRVSLLCYEHRPDLDVWQNRLKETVFPNKIQKSEMYLNSVNTLVSEGYLQVGLEHFVKPGDSLARAFKMNDLNWNMSGFTPGKGNHIIGIGPSAESRITDDYYFENYSSLPDYESAVEHGRFPICRSYKLNMDDKIRRDVIIKLRNSFSLDFLGIEKEYKIDFNEYFKDEIDKLDEFVGDGLLEINKKMMIISEQGKQFVSFVCRVFDKYA